MERNHSELNELDELFLARACELAARAIGDTAPNPPVGAVVVRDGAIAGEGYHHRAGDPHAEVHALVEAGGRARGATLYVSLEPCAHVGRTPPCTQAIIAAGVTRVVAGTPDPAGHGDARKLRDAGIEYVVAHDRRARALSEMFAQSFPRNRPYVAIKMATSLDGAVAPRPNVRERLTGEAMGRRTRDLRIAHDAVMVGARTVRIDDPRLTVRPPHGRLRTYRRIVVCGREPISAASRIFDVEEGYARTIVLAPGGVAAQLEALSGKADVITIGGADAHDVDLAEGLRALRERDVYSVLCEGGPQLATTLITDGLADRFYWAIAPRVFNERTAVPAFSAGARGEHFPSAVFDRAERVGDDVLLEGRFLDV